MYLNSFRIFLFILIFTPLAFGTVQQWSLTIMECLSTGALFIFFLSLAGKKEYTFYEVPGIVPLLCLWAYFVLQIIPLPSFLVRFISPETYKIYAETVGIMETVTWMSLSVHKKATLLELLRFTGYIAFYVLTVQLLTKKDLLKKTVSVVIIFSSLLAFYALIQHFFGSNKIYWFRETYGASPFGSFVNRNHYAGFMEMLFPIALGIFLAIKPRVSHLSFRERLAEFFKGKRSNVYLLIGLGCIIMAASVFMSLSRGGIISLSLSMLFFGALLLMRRTKRKRGTVTILIMTLIIISVGWFGWEPILNRFGKIMNVQGDIADLRIVFWKDCLQIINNFPVTGTGFGTFVDIFPKYATLTDEIIVQHAHNDYIELLANGGIVGFLLAGWFIITVMLRSFRNFQRRKDSYSVYLFIGSITGIISILFHSFTDFNLQIGSNGLYFFFLMGLMVSSANTRLQNGFNDTYLNPVKLRGYKKIITSFTAVVFIFVLIANLGIIIGNHYYSYIRDLRLDRISREDLIDFRNMAFRASLFDPLEARYSHGIANADMLAGDIEPAKEYYLKALKLNILNGEYAQRLGLAFTSEDMTITERLLKAGIASEPTNHSMYKTYAAWLLSAGRKDEAIMNINIALSISPVSTSDYIAFMILNGLSDDNIRASLPERIIPYMAFADYLLNSGNEKEAEEAYLQALRFIDREKKIKASYFYKVYEYYSKDKRFEDALNVMLHAKSLLPENAGIRYTAGAVYEKLGMPDMAINEYREALIIDPYNKNAKKRLKALTEIQN